jgi:tetratricopeptide (TPR) repeat protein
MLEHATPEHEHHRLGNAHYRLGQYRSAVDEYSLAITSNPETDESRFNRALAYARLGDYDAALLDATYLVARDGECQDSYYLRGRIHELALDDSSATNDFERVLALEPMHTGAIEHLRAVTEQRTVYAELRECRLLAEAQTDNGWLLFQLGRRFAGIGHQDDAVRSLEAARSAGYATSEFWLELGEAYTGYGNPVQGMAAFRQALRANPTDVVAYAHLGQLLNESGHYRDAAELLEQALELPHDDEASLRCGLGTAYMGLSRLDEASEQFERAISMRPRMADAVGGIAAVCRLRGQLETAWSWCQRALEDEPSLASAIVLSTSISLDQKNIANAAATAIRAFTADQGNARFAYLVWALYNHTQNSYRSRVTDIWQAHVELVERARYLTREQVTTRRELVAVRQGLADTLITSCPIAEETAELLYQRLAIARRDLLAVLYTELYRPDIIPISELLRRAATHAEASHRRSISELCTAYSALMSSSPEVPRLYPILPALERLATRNVKNAAELHDFYRFVRDGLSTESVEDVVHLRSRIERLILHTGREGFILPNIVTILVDMLEWLDGVDSKLDSTEAVGTGADWSTLADAGNDIRAELVNTVQPPEEWVMAALLTHTSTIIRYHEHSMLDS